MKKLLGILTLSAALAACGGQPPSDVGVATEKLSSYYTSTAFTTGSPPSVYPTFVLIKPLGASVSDFSGARTALYPGELITFTAGTAPGGGTGRDVFHIAMDGSVQAFTPTLSCTGLHLTGGFDQAPTVSTQGNWFPATEFPLGYNGNPIAWGGWYGYNDANSDQTSGTCTFKDPNLSSVFPARAPTRIRFLPYHHSGSTNTMYPSPNPPVLGAWNQGYMMIVMSYPDMVPPSEYRYYMNIVGNGS